MRWVEHYIGMPFDPVSFNCWHLVRCVMWDRAGLVLPAYGETDARDLAVVVHRYTARLVDPWNEVSTPQALDVAVMAGRDKTSGGRTRRVALHAGIMVDERRLLHVEEGTNVVMVPIDHVSVKFRLLGFYRHRGLRYATG